MQREEMHRKIDNAIANRDLFVDIKRGRMYEVVGRAMCYNTGELLVLCQPSTGNTPVLAVPSQVFFGGDFSTVELRNGT